MKNKNKAISFTDLKVWRKAHELAVKIYKITDKFPADEKYSLTRQIRRAGISVTSNIAEGFGRQTDKDKIHFYYMAKGSITEIQNQLLLARDIGYLENRIFQNLAKKTVEIHKMLYALIRSIKLKK